MVPTFSAAAAVVLARIIPAVMLLPMSAAKAAAGSAPMGMPGCDTRCGDMIVPYPFGMGRRECYHSPGFNVTCDRKSKPPRLLVGDGTLQVADHISADYPFVTALRTNGDIRTDATDGRGAFGGGLGGDGPLSLSGGNELVLTGCNVRATLTGGNVTISGCSSFCDYQELPMEYPPSRLDSSMLCSGKGCCQAPVVVGNLLLRPFTSYDVEIQHFGWNRSGDRQQLPQRVFVAQEGWFEQRRVSDQLSRQRLPAASIPPVPVYLAWEVFLHNGEQAASDSTLECPAEAARIVCKSDHTSCTKRARGGYTCYCDDGYTGNPYLTHGCQDIDECVEMELQPRDKRCYGDCTNKIGSFECLCPPGTQGNPYFPGGCFSSVKGSYWESVQLPI